MSPVERMIWLEKAAGGIRQGVNHQVKDEASERKPRGGRRILGASS